MTPIEAARTVRKCQGRVNTTRLLELLYDKGAVPAKVYDLLEWQGFVRRGHWIPQKPDLPDLRQGLYHLSRVVNRGISHRLDELETSEQYARRLIRGNAFSARRHAYWAARQIQKWAELAVKGVWFDPKWGRTYTKLTPEEILFKLSNEKELFPRLRFYGVHHLLIPVAARWANILVRRKFATRKDRRPR